MVFTGTAIEIIALIFLIIASIKLIVILISPKTWANLVVKKIWASSILMMIISLILAGIVLYYLLMELTIIQIFAVMVFVSLLAAAGVAMYSKEMIGLAQKLLKDRYIVKKSWFYVLIWIALIIWGFKELFM